MIPEIADKPKDGHTTKATMLKLLSVKKKQLEKLRLLTEGEVERLRGEFMIEFTYNSNTVENDLTLKETAMVIRQLM